MTNKQAEKRVKKAFSGAVPNTFEQILEKCQNTEADPKVIKMPKRAGYAFKKIISVAAALAIILTAGFAGYGIAKIETVDTVVSFDVNPSIELELSDDEKIVRANARNEDGEKILGEMNLNGSDLSVAVNAIIGSMLRNGYLDEISNTILISVDSNNAQKSAKLEKKLMDEISMLLSGESFDAAVLSQTVNATKEIKELAAKYGITIGKAQLIQQIIDADKKYTFKTLAPLTITELNRIISGEKINVSSNSEISQKRYISKSKAKEKALKDAKVKEKNIYEYECVMDYINRKLVYVVTFKTDTTEYRYEINATSGKIVDSDASKKYIGKEAAKANALEYAGATADQITQYKCTFRNELYEITFCIGLVRYYVTVDAILGEVVKSTPVVPADLGIEVPRINEAEAKKAATQELPHPEAIYDYSCVTGMNGKIPVYEIRFKVPYDTGNEKGILDCCYIINALNGEQLGVEKTQIKAPDEESSQIVFFRTKSK